MKVNNVLRSGIWFFLGMAIANLSLHIRFNNNLLRKELILLMEQGNNGYFLTWAIIPVIAIISLGGMLYYYNSKLFQSTGQTKKYLKIKNDKGGIENG